MNSRQRFHAVMNYERPDRVPYFEEGIRQEVLDRWYQQGLHPDENLDTLFHTDVREEINPDLGPHPPVKKQPVTGAELKDYRKRLDPDDPIRLTDDYQKKLKSWKQRQHVLMLRIHDGFFLTMGVGDWERFYEVIRLVKDDPGFIFEAMSIQADFAARLAENVLREVEVDAVIFSEPIGGMNGPIIAPWTYGELVLASYQPIFDVVHKYGVGTIILRTYANARVLITSQLEAGFNCLWACECETGAMNYRSIRAEFGKELRLVGGIDLDALRFGRESISHEVLDQVPPLLEEGGYIPLADGRVREDVPFADYLYYRRLLEKVTGYAPKNGGPFYE